MWECISSRWFANPRLCKLFAESVLHYCIKDSDRSFSDHNSRSLFCQSGFVNHLERCFDNGGGCHGNINGGYPGNRSRHGDCITRRTQGAISLSLSVSVLVVCHSIESNSFFSPTIQTIFSAASFFHNSKPQ